jgi:uncharacterized membrane protein YuzA (DUF378 family)
MKRIFYVLVGVGIIVSFGFASVHAQEVLGDTGGQWTYENFRGVVKNLVNFILQIASFAATGAVVYFGFRMVIAGSDATAYADARKGLNWSLVGAFVIFGVYTIIATVRGAVDSIGR